MSTTYGIALGNAGPALETRGLSVFYGEKAAVRDVSLAVPAGTIVSVIGPSGSGKSSLLRSFNRMNELQPDARTEGSVLLDGEDLYGDDVDPVEVRRRVGMIFPDPNPFPRSVYENVAFGLRLGGGRVDVDGRVRAALREVGLWEEVSGRLNAEALRLTPGQQQRLCVARAVAVRPDVLLMDEPASALDPIASQRVEELVYRLKEEYTVVIVPDSLQQAARISDYTAFLDEGELVEYGPTDTLFTNPREARAEAYLTGRLR